MWSIIFTDKQWKLWFTFSNYEVFFNGKKCEFKQQGAEKDRFLSGESSLSAPFFLSIKSEPEKIIAEFWLKKSALEHYHNLWSLC